MYVCTTDLVSLLFHSGFCFAICFMPGLIISTLEILFIVRKEPPDIVLLYNFGSILDW